MDGEGSETGAGAGGGGQQKDVPEKSENGDFDTVGAMSCGAPSGAGRSVDVPAGREEIGSGACVAGRSGPKVSGQLEWWPETGVRGQTCLF